MCNEKGGIIDDVIVSKISQDEFLIVVNSSNIKLVSKPWMCS
jgi:glycine cleavage system aminomethyltransferase T